MGGKSGKAQFLMGGEDKRRMGENAQEAEGETELTLLNGEHLRRGVVPRRVAARARRRRRLLRRRGVCIGVGVLIVQPLLRRRRRR